MGQPKSNARKRLGYARDTPFILLKTLSLAQSDPELTPSVQGKTPGSTDRGVRDKAQEKGIWCVMALYNLRQTPSI
jgi:hypothetical protein